MKRFFALALAGLLLLGCGACGGNAPSEPDTTTTDIPAPTGTQAPPKQSAKQPDSAFAWEPPDTEDSTQIELPEFPGVVFSNEYNKVPTEHGGFTWERYVKATSRGGEKKLFDFALGPNNVFIADITGDGYPDFVYMVSGSSGLLTLGVKVYDYANDVHYSLSGYGHGNGLAIENGKLMVARHNADGVLVPIGELVMADGKLGISGVEAE